MGAGSMTTITTYRLRGASGEALWAALAGASLTKARPYAWEEPTGERHFDEARVRLPFAETAPGAPVEGTDPDTGEVVDIVPLAPTGSWLCEVALVDEDDADLAAIALA